MQRYGSVYLVTNTVNGKCYVGQTTTSLSARWASHKWAARAERADSLFMRALRKYDSSKFRIEEIAVAENAAALDAAEDALIVAWNALAPSGYNVCLGNGGHRHSEETKARIRAHRHSAETRQQMSDSHKKRYLDPSERQKASRVQSAEERTKRSATMKRIGHRPKNTAESIARMAAAKRGKPVVLPYIIRCEDGRVFRNMTEAAEMLGASVASVSMHLSGKRKTVKNLRLEKVSV